MGKYSFGAPLHMVYAACVLENNPTLNGKTLTAEEQKVLSVLLWAYADQNMEKYQGDTIKKSLEGRWPEVNWKY